jgi:hypothetical protein
MESEHTHGVSTQPEWKIPTEEEYTPLLPGNKGRWLNGVRFLPTFLTNAASSYKYAVYI